jgi:hypothetical protein
MPCAEALARQCPPTKEAIIMVRRRGLIGSLARTAGKTAVVAGTATAVAGRVNARQQQRHAHAQPQPHGAARPAGEDASEMVAHLQQLGDLKASGLLTDKEFAAAKARLLKG